MLYVCIVVIARYTKLVPKYAYLQYGYVRNVLVIAIGIMKLYNITYVQVQALFWFPEIAFVREVCMCCVCMCVCMSAPQAKKNYSREMKSE